MARLYDGEDPSEAYKVCSRCLQSPSAAIKVKADLVAGFLARFLCFHLLISGIFLSMLRPSDIGFYVSGRWYV
jgi:hypothetical protein